MTINGWLQIASIWSVLTALVVPLGRFMAGCSRASGRFLSPVLRPVETVLYRASGVDETREQGWLTYTVAMLLFNAAGFIAVYGSDAAAGVPSAQPGRSIGRGARPFVQHRG